MIIYRENLLTKTADIARISLPFFGEWASILDLKRRWLQCQGGDTISRSPFRFSFGWHLFSSVPLSLSLVWYDTTYFGFVVFLSFTFCLFVSVLLSSLLAFGFSFLLLSFSFWMFDVDRHCRKNWSWEVIHLSGISFLKRKMNDAYRHFSYFDFSFCSYTVLLLCFCLFFLLSLFFVNFLTVINVAVFRGKGTLPYLWDRRGKGLDWRRQRRATGPQRPSKTHRHHSAGIRESCKKIGKKKEKGHKLQKKYLSVCSYP